MLQRYALGALHVHDLVWVKADAPADVSVPFPLQGRIQSTGHNTFIYDAGVTESWQTPNVGDPNMIALQSVSTQDADAVFGIAPQIHRCSTNTFYLRTTPGRLILNSLIYENLFL